jgi:uncharacterized lipoprotein YajG
MKKNTTISILAILLTGFILTVGCKKKSDATVGTGPVPVVVTSNYSNLLPTSVDFTGSVTNDGGSFVNQIKRRLSIMTPSNPALGQVLSQA